MTNEQINIAIAEACGWKSPFQQEWLQGYDKEGGHVWAFSGTDQEGDRAPLPDYCDDLNAMHEAENRLTSFQRAKHGKILQDLLNEHAVGFVQNYDRDFASLSRIASANARQRAKAFLRTIGKWEGGAK